ncbi:MAG: hypothetical protein GY711_34720 [bacterium]|nr:hypothetical protein [bacterium]
MSWIQRILRPFVGVSSDAQRVSAPALHRAVIDGDLDECRRLLEAGADPDLIAAPASSYRREAEKTTWLLDGSSALHLAAREGRLEIVRLLLKRGATVDLAVPAGQGTAGFENALHFAASGGHAQIVEALIAAGCGLDHAGGFGHTALMNAAAGGHAATVAALLAAGASVHEQLTLHAAKSGNDAVVAAAIAHGASPLAVDSSGRTALHYAAQCSLPGSLDVARRLLDAGVALDARDSCGETALHEAVRSAGEGMVRLLLERGADPSVAEESGSTPLHAAAEDSLHGHLAGVVTALLNAGASPDAEDGEGRTPLHAAVGPRGGEEFFNEEEANRAEDPSAYRVDVETVRLLLERGARVDARDEQGRTPLDGMRGTGDAARQAAELLRQHGA